MICLKILDVKQFMALLFTGSFFDEFYTREAAIKTFTDFSISGKRYKEYYTEEEEQFDRFVKWKELRGFSFQIIKGKKTPSIIKIVFQASEEILEQLKTQTNTQDVDALFLNIKFEANELSIVTGSSRQGFSLDKSIDRSWEDFVKALFKEQQIAFSEEV